MLFDVIEEPECPDLLVVATQLGGRSAHAPDVITGSAGEKSTPRATSCVVGDMDGRGWGHVDGRMGVDGVDGDRGWAVDGDRQTVT